MRNFSLVALSLTCLSLGCGESDAPGSHTGGSSSRSTGGTASLNTGGSTTVSTGGTPNAGLGGSTIVGTGGSATVSTGGSASTSKGGTGGGVGIGGTTSATGGVSSAGGGSTGVAGASSGGTASAGASGAGNAAGAGKGGTTSTTGGAMGTGGVPITPAPGDQWVSPTGNDANSGTQASPLKNLQTAVLKATPGSTIWMMAGTHAYEARVAIKSATVKLAVSGGTATSPTVAAAQDGTKDKPIRIVGVPGTRPVIDFKPQRDKLFADWAAAGSDAALQATVSAAQKAARGIALYAEYWYLKNLEIKNAGDNCIYVAGSYNTVDDVILHDCGDTGLQITGSEGDKTYVPSYNKIINCDSFLNIDNFPSDTSPGEDADGFAAKLEIGPGNEFHGCRSYQNCDDGWDFFAAQYPVTMSNCWVFDMNHPLATVNSDGNGFKLGGVRSECDATRANNTAPHKLTSCFAFHNPGWGFDMNNNTSQTITCDKCGGFDNGCKTQPKCNKNFEVLTIACENGVTSGTYQMQVTNEVTGLTVTNEQARSAKRDANGNLPDITTL